MRVCLHTEQLGLFSMSRAPPYEIKDEPRSGAGCEADAFMNMRGALNCGIRDEPHSGAGCEADAFMNMRGALNCCVWNNIYPLFSHK